MSSPQPVFVYFQKIQLNKFDHIFKTANVFELKQKTQTNMNLKYLIHAVLSANSMLDRFFVHLKKRFSVLILSIFFQVNMKILITIK